jgi:hypothetical protein
MAVIRAAGGGMIFSQPPDFLRNESSGDPSPRKHILKAVALCVGVAALAVFALLFYLNCVPPNRVKVSAINIPSGSYYVSFVAMRDGKVVNMLWSGTDELGMAFTRHPLGDVWSYQLFPDRPRVDWNSWVQWEFGEKYGVLTRMTDESWHIFWFDPTQVPIQGRRFLFGGGLTEFDCSKGKSEPVTMATVLDLGLAEVKQPKRLKSKQRDREPQGETK